MYTVSLAPSQALIGTVKRMLGLADAEVDERFGVIEVDPTKHLYAILVDSDAVERLSGQVIGGVAASNPRIESTGLDASD